MTITCSPQVDKQQDCLVPVSPCPATPPSPATTPSPATLPSREPDQSAAAVLDVVPSNAVVSIVPFMPDLEKRLASIRSKKIGQQAMFDGSKGTFSPRVKSQQPVPTD